MPDLSTLAFGSGYQSRSGVRRSFSGLLATLALVATVGTTLPRAAQAVEPRLASGYSMYAVKADGSLWKWDRGLPEQVAGYSGVLAVAESDQHRLVLLGNGEVWGSGSNDLGQLGIAGITTRTEPIKIAGLADMVSIAVTAYGSFAVKKDGTVWSWGTLCTSTVCSTVSTPTQVPGLINVTTVVAGTDSVAALKADGSVWTWGGNDSGQLGDGSTTGRFIPARIAVDGVVGLSAGINSFFARCGDGSVWVWGANSSGKLAIDRGTAGQVTVPTPVPVLSGFRHLATNLDASIGVSADGRLWTWGKDNFVPTLVSAGIPGPIVELAAGYYDFAVRTAGGEIWMWGDGHWRLGRVWQGESALFPLRVEGLAATQVAAGTGHSLALTAQGKVLAWGSNSMGQLGRTSPDRSAVPLEVPGVLATAVAACSYRSLALTTQGTVMSWGANGSMELLGHANSEPGLVANLTGITAIACGEVHSLALDRQGQVWTWGSNGSGQLDNGTSTGSSATPVPVAGLGNVVSIAAGGYFSLALTDDGRVHYWGSKGGRTCLPPSAAPTETRHTTVFAFARAFTAGFVDAYILGGDNAWYGWDGCKPVQASNVARLAFPVTFGTVFAGGQIVHPISLMNQISSSVSAQNYGLDSSGALWAWGDNSNGELGNGRYGGLVTVPSQTPYLADIRQVSAGGGHALALGGAGEVWAWGRNTYGQLAATTPTDFGVPKPVIGTWPTTPFNVNGATPNVSLKEYRVPQDGSYFYSALPAEQQLIESGGLGPGWSATGNNFKVWLGSEGPAGSYPVCRFRGDGATVSGLGHFYTALPSECDTVRNGGVPYWLYDGIGFYVYMPSECQGGGGPCAVITGPPVPYCPAGTQPIHRQYNARLHNHHFQLGDQLSAQQQADGWVMEGVPFCVGL